MGCYYHPRLETAMRCRDCGREICQTCSEGGICPGCRLGRAIKGAQVQTAVATMEAPRPGEWSNPASGSAPASAPRTVAPVTVSAAPTNEERALAALCYPLWPLSLLMLLVPLGRSTFVRFHVLQSLGVNGLGLALYLLYALLANVPVIGWQSAFALPFLVPLWMLGDLYLAVRAAGGHMPRVPFAGDLASRFD
ncbi:MAG: hypothetical protein JO219_11450 [Candidatus Eremiobacteraeota bacterium]|nr:hypothetical protein [Candidatus Eremiobacteraeota bacterium]MBV8367225.1 hypothetical protein [Candidatus Eremiobacteraeota bacterium]